MMTPEDATQLLELCEAVLVDLERFDKGADYSEVQLGESFRSIVEPMIQGDDLDPEFRRATPAALHGKLRVSIGTLRNGRGFSPGNANRQYGESVAFLKGALERFLQRSASVMSC